MESASRMLENISCPHSELMGFCRGTAVSGVIMPYIYPALLSNYSLATTLRAIVCRTNHV